MECNTLQFRASLQRITNGVILNYNSTNYIILLLLSKIYEIAYHSEESIRIAESDGIEGGCSNGLEDRRS